MAWDVGEELREVQPPEELHRVGVGALGPASWDEPLVEREGEGQLQGEDRARVQVRSADRTPGDAHGAAASPAHNPSQQEVLPLRVHVHRGLEELPQLTGTPRTCWCEDGSGGEAKAGWRRLSWGVAWRFLKAPPCVLPSCRPASLC